MSRPDWLLGYGDDGTEVRHCEPPLLGDYTWYDKVREMAAKMERPDPLAPPPGYGERAGRPGRSDTPAGQPEHECSRTCWTENPQGRACTATAIMHITLADEQEHHQNGDYCLPHANTYRTLVLTGGAYCTKCRELARDGMKISDKMTIAEQHLLPWADEGDPAGAALERIFDGGHADREAG